MSCFRAASLIAAVLLASSTTRAADPPAQHRTTNFVVHAATPEVARNVAEEAERIRKQLAERWTGKDLPAWSKACVIRVSLGPGPSGGSTVLDFGTDSADKPVLTLAEVYLQGDLK